MEEATQTSGQPNKIILTIGAVVLLVIAGGAFAYLNSNKTTQPAQQPVVQEKTTQEPTLAQSATESATKTFAVEGKPFSFTPAEIKVKKGDTVKVVFTNKAGFHDWTLDEFNVKTKQIKAGQSDEVTFVASKSGTFEYYCSVGNHRQQGMVGKFIVE